MADQKQAPAAGGEEKKNCPQCKKPMKKAKRFYRDGQYFCNFNCWRAHKNAAKEAAKEAAAAAKPEEVKAEQ